MHREQRNRGSVSEGRDSREKSLKETFAVVLCRRSTGRPVAVVVAAAGENYCRAYCRQWNGRARRKSAAAVDRELKAVAVWQTDTYRVKEEWRE